MGDEADAMWAAEMCQQGAEDRCIHQFQRGRIGRRSVRKCTRCGMLDDEAWDGSRFSDDDF